MVNRSSAKVSYHLRSYSLMHMHTLAFIPMKTNRREKMCFYRISAIACRLDLVVRKGFRISTDSTNSLVRLPHRKHNKPKCF